MPRTAASNDTELAGATTAQQSTRLTTVGIGLFFRLIQISIFLYSLHIFGVTSFAPLNKILFFKKREHTSESNKLIKRAKRLIAKISSQSEKVRLNKKILSLTDK